MGLRNTRDSSPSYKAYFIFYLVIFAEILCPRTLLAEDRQPAAGNAMNGANGGAAHAAGEAAKHGQEAAKAEQEGDPMKAAMEMAMMMAQLAQMAAALAAAKKNKEAKDKAQANPPVEKPEVPEPSMKAENKESPKLDLPQSPETPPTEVAEAPEPAPAPAPEFLAPQIAADHPDEMPEAAIAKNFDSEIPESIPNREKLGYDENGDGTKPNPGRSNFSSELSLASGLKDDRLFIPLDPENKGRKAKGDPSHEEGSDGGGDSGGAEGSAVPRTDFASMISAALGKGEGTLASGLPPGADLAHGAGAAGKGKGSSVHRELADTGELNIFQFASARYRELSKQGDVNPRGRLTITHAEREKLIAEFSSKNYIGH